MDYNKLWSLINKQNLSKSAAGRIVGMSPQGFITMMERKSMAVDILEKFAHFFNVSPSYFFEDSSPKIYKTEEKVLAVEDRGFCSLCAAKDKLIALQEKHIELLEFNLGKFRKNGSE